MIWQIGYRLLWRVIPPVIRAYLKKRAKKNPDYCLHWDERFGLPLPPEAEGAIWIHAVSVGETRAAQPLIQALQQRFPLAPLLLTQMTPTGRETARQLYPDAIVRYLPYDRLDWISRYFSVAKPRVGVLMETEIWPNLTQFAAKAEIPLFLANARLSEKSLNGYQKIAGLIRPAVQSLKGIAAQTQQDAERLRQLGASQIAVMGNTKFDCVAPTKQIELGQIFRSKVGQRPVLVCGSTRQGEEFDILQAWALRADRSALLVLVPRHPERFDEVEALIKATGLTYARRSNDLEVSEDCQIWLGDSMGELFAYYQLADIAFIGGSLQPLGGQNLIEAASLGRPVLIGPSTFNFAEASQQALQAGAALTVHSAEELIANFFTLMADREAREAMQKAALAFAGQHQGASDKMACWIEMGLS